MNNFVQSVSPSLLGPAPGAREVGLPSRARACLPACMPGAHVASGPGGKCKELLTRPDPSLSQMQTRTYTADDVHGFRVAASDLPVAPVAAVPGTSTAVATATPVVTPVSSVLGSNYQTSWQRVGPLTRWVPGSGLARVAPSCELPSSTHRHLRSAPRWSLASMANGSPIAGQVLDSPAVVAAKAEHLTAVQRARLRSAAIVPGGHCH